MPTASIINMNHVPDGTNIEFTSESGVTKTVAASNGDASADFTESELGSSVSMTVDCDTGVAPAASETYAIYDTDGSSAGAGFTEGDWALIAGTSTATYSGGAVTFAGDGLAAPWSYALPTPSTEPQVRFRINSNTSRVYIQYRDTAGVFAGVVIYTDPSGGLLGGNDTLIRLDEDFGANELQAVDIAAAVLAQTGKTYANTESVIVRGNATFSSLSFGDGYSLSDIYVPATGGGGSLPDLGALKAIPFAEGYGSDAVGGRGTTVHTVTNTNDGGTGSLAEVLNRPGPAYVVPVVHGYAQPSTSWRANEDNKTLYGQAAPGDGFVIIQSDTFDRSALTVEASQFVINHMTFAGGPGPASSSQGRPLTVNDFNSNVNNFFSMNNDYLFGTDQNMGIWYNNQNIGFYRDVFAEPLDDSNHNKGRHGYAFLAGGDDGMITENVSLGQCVMAFSNQRNPLITIHDNIVFESSLIHACVRGIDVAGTTGELNGSIRNIVFRNTGIRNGWADCLMYNSNYGINIFVEDNYMTNDGVNFTDFRYIDGELSVGAFVEVPTNSDKFAATRPSGLASITPISKENMVSHLNSVAGARPNNRYSHTARIMSQVVSGTGGLVNNVPGGYPTLNGGAAKANTSRPDLMSDAFMSQYGIDSSVNGLTTSSGNYSLFEHFMHWLGQQA